MKLIPNHPSKYGKFDLVPDPGQQLRHFIDFESKLLVISETPIDTSHLPSQHGIISITPKTYIIDPAQQKVLSFEEWKEYFSYAPLETFSEDKKLKEIWIRKHEPERNTDAYEGYLIEVETGKKIIDKASSVAFHDKQRTSLIQHYYKSIERRKQYLKSLEKGIYPENKFQDYLANIKEGTIIFQFADEIKVYQLVYHKNQFTLFVGPRPLKWSDWENLVLENKIETFDTIQEFWGQYFTDPKWFMKYGLNKIDRVMEKFVISAHNQLLDQEELSYAEHEKLHSWMNRCFNKELERNVYWQFCSNCRERVFYNPRYPKHACKNCVRQIKDENGNPLDYQETHELLGSRLRLKKSKKELKLFIDQNEYWASEARFGGIVYQKKE